MSAQDPKVALWLENLRDEWDGAALYRGLADAERDPERARQFTALAEAEARHAAIWRRKLEKAGVAVPPERASARVRTLLWLARRFGTRSVLPLALRAESGDVAKYDRQGSEAAALAAEERAHGETLRRMSGEAAPGARAYIAAREHWHRSARGGALRAAVFGMNDGLVSNLALVLGVAAAGAERRDLLVAGLAGLFAGALSMAVGEYVSMATQRDLLRRQIVLESRELAEAPEEEEAELVQIFRGKGLTPEQAAESARQIMRSPDSALDTLVREELGLDPADLGSPIRAALSSFFTFAAGASVPLVPLVFLSGSTAALVAAGLGGLVLGSVGALLGFLSGVNPARAAVRMVLLAALAAGVTVGVGRLVGASLG